MRSYGSLDMITGRPRGRPSRLVPAMVVVVALAAAVLAVNTFSNGNSHSTLLSMPMSSMMNELHDVKVNEGFNDNQGFGAVRSGLEGAAVVSSLRQLDQPAVQDTTGRTLTSEAIKASGLSDQGKLSGDDLAVLETAGSLTPQLAQRKQRGELPTYIQVAQRAAFSDANDSEYMDAIPGNIVTIKDEEVDPRVAARKGKQILDKLNKGYAKSMQKWLTGSDEVGDVTKAIDTRSASFLANTGDMGKPIDAETEKVILDAADKQHFREKKGLVKSEAEEGEIPQEVRDAMKRGDSIHELNHMLQAEKAVPNLSGAGATAADASAEGVLHTDDGFILRIDPRAAGRNSLMRPIQSKAMLSMLAATQEQKVDPREKEVDGCLCTGSSDEDKGPKCSCIGDPDFPVVSDKISDPWEITRWSGKEVHEQSQFKRSSPQMLAAEKEGVAGANSIEPTADGINAYLVDMSLRAEQHKGAVDEGKLAHFRSTVQQLQGVVLRDPQSRDLIARRLSLLKSSVAKSQKLQDHDSVYLAPYVDDLDNYLQGVLNEVNKVEIPTLEEDEDKAVKGAQTLHTRMATSSSASSESAQVAVLPNAGSIKSALSALVTAADKLNKGSAEKMAHLKETAAALSKIVERVPESRDLVAERLRQYKGRQAMHADKAGTQSLQDYDSVYLAPYVDDLDNYLQGILDLVNKTEIPSLDDDEDKAVAGGLRLKSASSSGSGSRFTSLMPIHVADGQRRFTSLMPIKLGTQVNVREYYQDHAHGGPPAFKELGDFRQRMEWQKHPLDSTKAERHHYWMTSEDSFAPQDATMVYGAGRLRREAKSMAVHNPYGWLGAKAVSGTDAEVPVTTADSQDTRNGGIKGGYALGAGVSTRTSLEKGSKLCQLVNCDNQGVIPFPPAARAKQLGLTQALADWDKATALLHAAQRA